MDSGNSGSMSSSGGEEEYDSRAESISSFLNPTSHIGPMTNPPQQPPSPPPPHHHHHNPNSSMFDPLSNYFDHPLSRPSPLQPLSNPNSLLNLDTVWSKTLRSDPNCTQINPILASPPSVQPFFGSQGQPRGLFTNSSSSSPTVHFPPVAENTITTPRASSSSAANNDQNQTHAVRNPKKRSRASRRAPTTVLTTDTTNFRAMVQEFTGIPAPPFTSSPFPRSRIDFFGTPSSIRSNPLDASQQQTPYLLRPFAQKFQPPPFVSSYSPSSSSSSSLSSSFLSSSMVDGLASTSTNNNNNNNNNHINSGTSTTTVSNSTSVNYHHQGLLNMQNPILTFQSLLQSAPKYPLANHPIHGSKSLEIPSNDSHLKMGVLDEFGLSHGHVNHTQLAGLPNLVSSDRTASRTDNNPASWADGVGSSNTDQSHLRSVNGNYGFSQSLTNGKLHYSASSSNFHSEKGSENVPTRGEGMMESWICSSD